MPKRKVASTKEAAKVDGNAGVEVGKKSSRSAKSKVAKKDSNEDAPKLEKQVEENLKEGVESETVETKMKNKTKGKRGKDAAEDNLENKQENGEHSEDKPMNKRTRAVKTTEVAKTKAPAKNNKSKKAIESESEEEASNSRSKREVNVVDLDTSNITFRSKRGEKTAPKSAQLATIEEDEKMQEEKPEKRGARGKKQQTATEKSSKKRQQAETEKLQEVDEKEEKRATKSSTRNKKVEPKKTVASNLGEFENKEKSKSKKQKISEESDEDQPIKSAKSKKAEPKKPVAADSEESEMEQKEEPPKKGKSKKQKIEENQETDDEVKPTKSKRKKVDTKKIEIEDEQKIENENEQKTENENEQKIAESPKDNLSSSDSLNLHICCWNVGGLRAWLKKDGLSILQREKPDILCVQEVKCGLNKIPPEVKEMDGYTCYWCASDKEGYAGVGLITKKFPMDVKFGIGSPMHDNEGRCITAEFEKYYLVNVYVPNAGRRLVTLPKRLEWNAAFKKFIKELDEKKPVILCGDMNVAHNEIDLANPKSNKKNAGFTIEEREGMTDFLNEGFVDIFRHLNPEKTGAYTFWTYMAQARAKNVGWRLDYFLLSKRIIDKVNDNILLRDTLGSDHCPLSLYINI